MISAQGFDLACAKAAYRAMRADDPTFIERCRKVEFHGLYDPGPVGAVLLDGNVIHVASLRPCGLTVKKIVGKAFETRNILFAPIAVGNEKASALAELLGFEIGLTESGYHLYWRAKK